MVTENFSKQKNAQVNKPIYLYTLFDYDGLGNNLNWCEWDSDIKFPNTTAGTTYEKAPITHNEIGENSQWQIDAVKIKTSNVSREIQAYLENYDFRGKAILVRLVWFDKLDDPDCKLDFTYYIDNYTADQKYVEFTVLPKVDVINVVVPKRMYRRNYCDWVFGSSECGHTIVTGETCNKTKQGCKLLNNYSRFGGFPAIPSRKIIIG